MSWRAFFSYCEWKWNVFFFVNEQNYLSITLLAKWERAEYMLPFAKWKDKAYKLNTGGLKGFKVAA